MSEHLAKTSRFETTIVFDGDALRDRKIDLAELAPSLNALAELIQETNIICNGGIAEAKVYVTADVKQNSFGLGFEFFVEFLNQASSMIDVALSAPKLLETLIGTPENILDPVRDAVGLFYLMKKLIGKKKDDIEVSSDPEDDSSVIINIKGHNNSIKVNRYTYEMYNSPRVIEATKDFMEPLNTDGYESISFRNAKTGEDRYRIEESDFRDDMEEELPSLTTEVIKERVKVRRTTLPIRVAIYEGNQRWEFMYRKRISAKMEDYDWLKDFQSANQIKALPGSRLDVDLEETVRVDEAGNFLSSPTYRVLKVHDVIPAPRQMGLIP